MAITRRSFIKRAAASGVAATAIMTGTKKAVANIAASNEFGTIIDLTKCDGCINYETPLCVSACKEKNQANYPEPEKPIMDYWPQKVHEDWSGKRDLTNRLTPYNWTYVQHLEVEHNGQKVKVHVPRRCLHCDNPPCAGLCPFGVNNKMPEGPVIIDTNICMGGAKCRDVCPWEIPQRQAGVGLYKEVAPKFAGGGVMYKCDMCYDLILAGQEPACVNKCPNGAISFGPKKEMQEYARKWAGENRGYIYGDVENGGTSTFYLSSVPFAAIDQAIRTQEIDGKPGRPVMPVGVKNSLDKPEGLAKGFIIAPIAGVMAAGLSVYQIMNGGRDDDEDSEA